MRFELRNVSKQRLHRLGHPVGHPPRLGPCQGGLFVLNAPCRQGVWAATTTMALVRSMEWRPPLLYANPLRLLRPCHPENLPKMHQTRTINERAVQCAVHAVRMFLSKPRRVPCNRCASTTNSTSTAFSRGRHGIRRPAEHSGPRIGRPSDCCQLRSARCVLLRHALI